MKRHDPRSLQEWEEVLEMAEFMLLLNSARQYGLVTGGPVVDVERCAEIIKKGRAKGYMTDKAFAHLSRV